jgi:hypothetical protein
MASVIVCLVGIVISGPRRHLERQEMPEKEKGRD